MSNHRRAAKRDKNEPEIIEALVGVGASVSQINGTGVPDLCIGFRGVTYLIEVKAKKGKLTADQLVWHENWQGQVAIVRSVTEALVVIGAI